MAKNWDLKLESGKNGQDPVKISSLWMAPYFDLHSRRICHSVHGSLKIDFRNSMKTIYMILKVKTFYSKKIHSVGFEPLTPLNAQFLKS